MEEFHHFSHDHPLTTLFEDYKEVEDDDEGPKPYFCSICGLPILCSPSYTCGINGCKFFLHKPCAQLPTRLKNPRYHPVNDDFPHTLSLKANGESSRNFTYNCEACEFSVHPLVVGAVDIKVKHKSHQSHPLVAIHRETLSLCDTCGQEQRGFFFTCQECNFWIHPDCTLLSNYLKIASHPHPLILMYSLTQFPAFLRNCAICDKEALMNIGFYYCGECNFSVHVSCAKPNVDNLKTETRVELIQLPDDDEGDTHPSLVIRRHIELHMNPIADHHQDDKTKLMTINEKYHKHPNLILRDDASTSREEACSKLVLVCDVCIQPIDLISSPFYTCQLQSDDDEYCHFLVHNICANILSRIDFSAPSKVDFLYDAVPCPDPSKFVFDSVFPCFVCRRPCNGFCCPIPEAPYFVDLECLIAPYTMKHASHRQHVLFYTTRGMDNTIPLTCCRYESFFDDVYTCFLCDFYIHVRCALLPKRTLHKFDEHPLELITHRHNYKSSNIEHDDECCFCEFCERDIEQQYWHYGCSKCEHYFHINCIPSVGYLSKVKFGRTHVDDKHQHPITLTRMLTHGRHERCGYCKDIIRGFVDEMAFRCSRCDFWIHFSCARDSSCAPELRVYWEVEEELEREARRKLNSAM